MSTSETHPQNCRISIVIPCRKWDTYLQECVEACGRLEINSLTVDLWILSDGEICADLKQHLRNTASGLDIVFRETGPVNPATKRNVALKESEAEIFALIDADAFPESHWLQESIKDLKGSVAVVAGPNLTPPDDPLLQRVTGRVMESPVGFGAAYVRHTPVPRHEETEMPTCNMVIRRLAEVLFHEDMDTAEDMMYCADVRKRGYSVFYSPEVIVYHHRRRFGTAFVRQFFYYGMDKGFLFHRRHGATHLWHLAPALLTLYLILLIPLLAITSHLPWICVVMLLPSAAYLIIIAVESFRRARTIAEFLLSPLAHIMAHLSYGTGFLCGAFSPRKRHLSSVKTK